MRPRDGPALAGATASAAGSEPTVTELDEDRVGTFRRNRHKLRGDVSSRERRTYVEPVMDRELPLALFAAAVAAIVLVGIQVQSSSAARNKEAAAHAIYKSAQHRPDSRFASSQLKFADTFEQSVR